MENFFKKFSLTNEKESFDTVYANIEAGVVFRGTNLWILIFAIFVASLGLNVNSTAVIIGAMLISPLMGPIMGMGLGLAINDMSLLRKAAYNFGVATLVALATSTLFFLISPINDAHSEILARTSPNVYDVLIALFGGLAGTLATSSRQKGNVIPGVAIATALMPPLCTAGYGLATFQFSFFFGAFYLFVINTVFIALATLLMSRVLKFPIKGFDANENATRRRLAIWLITLLTLLPSIYFAFTMVRNENFNKKARSFIAKEASFDNDYLLSSEVDAEDRKISLVYGGREIRQSEIDSLRARLGYYQLEGAELEVKQGFAYLASRSGSEREMVGKALDDQSKLVDSLRKSVQELQGKASDASQVFRELKTQYPQLTDAIIQSVQPVSDSAARPGFLLAVLTVKGKLTPQEREKIAAWLKIRLHEQQVKLLVTP
jgi:uncharacterized hydrophobic protein (TIGR00271 family)